MTAHKVSSSQWSAMDAIDEVYNLAYWMTGSEASAGMLLSQTYQTMTESSSLADAYRALRENYVRSFGNKPVVSEESVGFIDDADVARAVLNLPADFKMVVLLADVAALSHDEIASIIEMPIDTVRAWLHWGRTALSKDMVVSLKN
jgi:hypothetical protein